MRILIAIAHHFDEDDPGAGGRVGFVSQDPRERAAALAACIRGLHQLFAEQATYHIAEGRMLPANEKLTGAVHVVVCTAEGKHLLGRLPVDPLLYYHHPTPALPSMLGFECQTLLRDRWGNYDFYGYMEDDLIVHDPWLFQKLAWFNNHVGNDKVLLPNRYECGPRPAATKTYVDGDLAEKVTAPLQDLKDTPQLRSQVLGRELAFRRALNPYSGCYFLNAEQMAHWTRQRHFLDHSTAFVGPWQSAACLGLLRSFNLYKPARENANFLEVEHSGDAILRQLNRPT